MCVCVGGAREDCRAGQDSVKVISVTRSTPSLCAPLPQGRDPLLFSFAPRPTDPGWHELVRPVPQS